MQCPKCKTENFKIDKPCPECGFQGDTDRLMELDRLQWLLNQMAEWENFDIGAAPVSTLKKVYTAHLKETRVELGLRPPPFTPEEAEKAWVELTHLEALFEKVEEWRNAGYFKVEMDGLDPVKTQRVHAEELRQRLEEYQRPESPQTDKERVKTLSFLLDNIDLLVSRQWFKSKKEIKKAVAPITSMMVNMVSDNESE